MSKLTHSTDEGTLQVEMRRMLEDGHSKDEVLDALQDWCKSNVEKIGEFSHCPKCTFAAGDYLARFCTHKFCPLRDWRNYENSDQIIREKVERARAEEDEILRKADEIRARRAS